MKTGLALVFSVIAHNALLSWVPPPPVIYPGPPHHDVNGTDAPKAEAVFRALNAVLEYKLLPTPQAGQQHDLPKLYCSSIWTWWEEPPFNDHYCNIQYRIVQNGEIIEIELRDGQLPLKLSENLFNALLELGSTNVQLRYGIGFDFKNVTSKVDELHFDDYATYHPPVAPNIIVQDVPALNLIQIFDSMTKDIDDTHNLGLIICRNLESVPECAYQFYDANGGLILYPPLDSELSTKLSNAIRSVAVAAGLQAQGGGSIEDMNFLNLSGLEFDDINLRMHLKYFEPVSSIQEPPPIIPPN